MRKNYIVFLFLVVCTRLFSQEVKFEIGEWYPFTSTSRSGLAIELLEAACNEVGIKPVLSFSPWRRAEQNVRTGASYGTFPYVYSKERSVFFYFSDPLLISETVMAYNTDNKKIEPIQKISDLKKYKIGVIAGSNYIIDQLKRYGIVVEETETVEASYQKLELGRIDLFIDDIYVVKSILRKKPTEKIKYAKFSSSISFSTREYRIMVTKAQEDSLKILERINLGLGIIRKKGLYQSILSRY